MATRKVEVTLTRTYYKTATIEVEVDENIKDDELIVYLTNYEGLDTDLENELGESDLDGGDDEWEFQDPTNNFGGHL
jgi:hypothetical protein